MNKLWLFPEYLAQKAKKISDGNALPNPEFVKKTPGPIALRSMLSPLKFEVSSCRSFVSVLCWCAWVCVGCPRFSPFLPIGCVKGISNECPFTSQLRFCILLSS